MKVFITKYSLTKGILEVEAIPTSYADVVGFKFTKANYFTSYAHKGEWFNTLTEAEAKAKEMAVKKKATLLKQIAKLEKKFGV